MKKWVILFIVFVLMLSVVTTASADPGNGKNAYTMPARCGAGDVTIQVLNDNSPASFRVDVKGSVGILKAIFILWEGEWIPITNVPGIGVYERTTVCTWEEGGYRFMSKVLIPH